ncbi:response regulator transcription factor [soil metagenome]
MIRVLLVDDHASFRQPLAFMLDREEDMSVVGQAGSIAEVRDLLKTLDQVDVAVMDLGLPDGSGVEVIGEVRRHMAHGRVLVLSGNDRREIFADAVAAGASGVLNKSTRIDEIIDAVRRLSTEESLLSPSEIVSMMRLSNAYREQDHAARQCLARLTPRERNVLQALAEGLTDKDIARSLFISSETVRTHMVNILSKLGVDSRLQALVFAIRYQAVSVDQDPPNVSDG